ncbi:MAG: hypothetical protein VXZ35_09620 [Pseudomonadota bacterium]|nr:hypothetical protein [Pseudomonadota bacterium]
MAMARATLRIACVLRLLDLLWVLLLLMLELVTGTHCCLQRSKPGGATLHRLSEPIVLENGGRR